MAVMLRQMVSEVLRRDAVDNFYDAEVIDHSQQYNCTCHTQQEPIHETTIGL